MRATALVFSLRGKTGEDGSNGADTWGSRISTSGLVLDPAGIPIATGAGNQYYCNIASDGAHYLVVWTNYVQFNYDIYAARVNATGSVLDPSGILVSTAANTQTGPDVIFRGSGYLIVWEDYRSGSNWDIYGVRTSRTGTVLDSTGIAIASEDGDQANPALAFDGMDYIAVWEDGRNGSSTDIYASRINNDGTVLDSSGIAVTTASGAQYEPDLACDGTDCLIAWHDFRSGSSYDIYGARLGGDGSVLDPSGIAVSTAAGHEYNPAVGFDGSNYFVAWQGDPNGQSYGIYGSRVTTGGTVLDPSAITISSAAYHKVKPALSFNGTNYLVAWEECRNEFYTDIYGIRMSGDGTLLDPTDQLLLANGNPFSLAFDGNYHRLVAWKYADGGTRFEAAGTWVHPSGVPMDGAGSSLLAENDTVEGIDIAAAGDNSALLAYSRYDDDPEINGTAVFGRVLLDHFQSKSVTRLAGGEVQIDWQTNPDVTEATGVNIYSSRSFDENYDRLNIAPLPLTGSYVDDSQRAGVPNYYWLELIFAGGTTSKERRDVEWITPEAVDTDFVVAVRESTVAAVPGGTSVYDVEVLSQKGYTGTVDLTAVGLPAAAVSAVFDPASVEVPGHSTLTVNWDPLLAPPTGGYDYPFEITASESGGASLVIHTVDVTGVVIDPDDEYLTQFVYPAEPEAGHDAEVFGRLAPPQSGQAVTVTTGVSADVFTATTDAEGFFSQTVSVAAAGSVSFASSTAGASAAPYVTNARRGRRQIRMTATTADGLIDPSDLVEVDGEIDPVPGTGDVYVRITNPDGTSAHADYVTVDEYGTFHQSFYAQEGVTEVEAELPGDADYYNASARLNVPANAPIGMAIVVAAGGETDNPMWDATGVLTDRAYNVYKGRLIPEDRIRYLHPDASRDPDSDGTPEVAAAPTKAELQAAIETWASALVDVSVTSAPFKTPLTLYIAGVETSPSVIQLNETETLTAAELGTWLNAYLANVQDRYPRLLHPRDRQLPAGLRSGQHRPRIRRLGRVRGRPGRARPHRRHQHRRRVVRLSRPEHRQSRRDARLQPLFLRRDQPGQVHRHRLGHGRGADALRVALLAMAADRGQRQRHPERRDRPDRRRRRGGQGARIPQYVRAPAGDRRDVFGVDDHAGRRRHGDAVGENPGLRGVHRPGQMRGASAARLGRADARVPDAVERVAATLRAEPRRLPAQGSLQDPDHGGGRRRGRGAAVALAG